MGIVMLGLCNFVLGGSNAACSHFCNEVHVGSNKGLCISMAAHGMGDCYKCGPKSTSGSEFCGLGCCASDSPTCCSGACVNLDTDINNCGTCGQHCPNDCVNGVCQSSIICTRSYRYNFADVLNSSDQFLSKDPYGSFNTLDGYYVFSGGANGVIVQWIEQTKEPCWKPYYIKWKDYVINTYTYVDINPIIPTSSCPGGMGSSYTSGGALSIDSFGSSPRSCILGLFLTFETNNPDIL